MRYLTLIPAYGRDYTSVSAVKADFNADKDFLLCDIRSPWDGKPINRPQIEGPCTVKIRYNGLQSVAVIQVK